ncbi:mechanosensitive ion channel family protein [Alcaligenaceae bacterium CGII-47]|nr:mechanosensitive ion channel family protein [Alcaligenaceae bacterium CGII-47]
MNYSPLIQQGIDIYKEWADTILVFGIILLTLIAGMVVGRILGRLARHTDSVRYVWTHGVLVGASTPTKVLIWIVGVSAAATVLVQGDVESILFAVLVPARNVAVIVVVMWGLLRITGSIQLNILARARAQNRELDPTATDAIGKLIRASIVITSILTVMQTLGFSIAGVLAFGGVGGIAIGFAAQSLVANLLGGLTIFASRPFKVGEYIIIPGTELMGGVEHIGWRATRLIGFDCKPFYVPNAMFNTQPIINHSRMTSRRIMETLHVRYSDIDVIHAIANECRQMIGSHPEIKHDFFAFNFDSCGESSLKLFLYAFTVSTDYNDYMNVKEDVLLRVAQIIRSHGAQLAMPISNVYMPEGLHIQQGSRPVDQPSSSPELAGMGS